MQLLHVMRWVHVSRFRAIFIMIIAVIIAIAMANTIYVYLSIDPIRNPIRTMCVCAMGFK